VAGPRASGDAPAHANQSGYDPETGPNPDWFGHQRDRGVASADTAAHSLPSMRQLDAAQCHRRNEANRPQPAVNCSIASSGRMRWSIAPRVKKLRRRSPLSALAAAAITMPWSSAR